MRFSSKKRHPEQGYMLVTLMLFVALLAIASMAWIERVDFQIKRDREEELVHRGVQYSRAIRAYVRKFGRYPARIEDLEKTNNIRYLRKRYKDPITGKDFKLLHQNDVQMSFSPAAASGLPPGAVQGGAPGSLNPNATATGGVGPVSGNPQNGQQDAGNQQATDDNSNGDQTPGTSNGAPQSVSAQASPNGIGNGTTGNSLAFLGNGQTFGGLPIVGVTSISKDKSIREFNKKDHYNQWQFIYDPSTDRGGLLTTPNQPTMQGATPINQMGGQQGQSQGFTAPGGVNLGPGGVNAPNMPGGVNTPNMPPENPAPQNQQ